MMSKKVAVMMLVLALSLAFGIWIESMRTLFPMLALVWCVWFYRKTCCATIEVCGDSIVAKTRRGPEMLTYSKPLQTDIKELIEWYGYEGTWIDLVWKDQDIWTFSEKDGLSSSNIQAALEKSGFGKVPIKRSYRVFRPQMEDPKT
jgi:hypothetical protein